MYTVLRLLSFVPSVPSIHLNFPPGTFIQRGVYYAYTHRVRCTPTYNDAHSLLMQYPLMKRVPREIGVQKFPKGGTLPRVVTHCALSFLFVLSFLLIPRRAKREKENWKTTWSKQGPWQQRPLWRSPQVGYSTPK